MTAVLIFFSIVPPAILAVLMCRFAKLDEHHSRYSPMIGFIFGGIVVGIALVVQLPLLPLLQHMGTMKVLFLAFIIAGLVEEGVKLAAMRLAVGPKIPNPRSAITIGVAAGCGFAAIENLITVFSAQYTVGNGLEVAISRALTSVPAHAAFGAVMGFCFSRNNLGKVGRYGIALLLPMFLHGWFNAPQLWAIQAGLAADGRFALPVLAATWVLVALVMDIARKEASPNSADDFDAEAADLFPTAVPAPASAERS